eukprot:m.173406 g.173406  ORF g.173406 m.173406 type:complete len:537 (-) comp14586_c3_seq2:354-1964(-)
MSCAWGATGIFCLCVALIIGVTAEPEVLTQNSSVYFNLGNATNASVYVQRGEPQETFDLVGVFSTLQAVQTNLTSIVTQDEIASAAMDQLSIAQAAVSNALDVLGDSVALLSTSCATATESLEVSVNSLNSALDTAVTDLNDVANVAETLSTVVDSTTSTINGIESDVFDLSAAISTTDSTVQSTSASLVNTLMAKVVSMEAAHQAALASLSTQVAASTTSMINDALADAPTSGDLPSATEAGDCSPSTAGRLRYHENSVQVCTQGEGSATFSWAPISIVTLHGGTAATAGSSCKQIMRVRKESGLATENGAFWILRSDSGQPMKVLCDFKTNGGGWTLVAYAGSISGNKANTAETSAYWPLFGVYGNYDEDALSSRASFSLMKHGMFSHIFKDTSEILIRRTGRPQNQMIWPVGSVSDYNKNRLPVIPYITFTNDGSSYVRRTQINIFPSYGCAMPCYTGYDWNMCGSNRDCGSSNCDGCGSYGSQLSHRGMLYWETGESDYTANQWFHGAPMALSASSGPDNSVQDIEFWLREA